MLWDQVRKNALSFKHSQETTYTPNTTIFSIPITISKMDGDASAKTMDKGASSYVQ